MSLVLCSEKSKRAKILDGSRLKTQSLEAEIEKRRFREWQLRAQLQDMQKRCNEALGLQRVEMVRLCITVLLDNGIQMSVLYRLSMQNTK